MVERGAGGNVPRYIFNGTTQGNVEVRIGIEYEIDIWSGHYELEIST